MGKELPMNVAVLMGIADFMSSHLLLTIIGLVAVPTLLYFYVTSDSGQETLDDLSVKFPIIKGFIRDIETTRIFKTLEVLVKNGVHLVTALRISAGVASNRHYKELLGKATVALKEGQQVAPKLHGDLIPDLAVDLLAGPVVEDGGRHPEDPIVLDDASIERLGGRVIEGCAVRTVETAGWRVAGVVTERGAVACNSVVCAAGAWSALFNKNLGLALPQLRVKASVLRTRSAPLATESAVWCNDVSFRRRQDGG